MVRLLRKTVAVLVALSWMIGSLLPVVPAAASMATPAMAMTIDLAAHDGMTHEAADHDAVTHDAAALDPMPCHEDGAAPSSDTGKAKPCPAVALCAKCFQALPTFASPAIRRALPIAAVTGSSDQQAESLAPAPPRKPPRA